MFVNKLFAQIFAMLCCELRVAWPKWTKLALLEDEEVGWEKGIEEPQ